MRLQLRDTPWVQGENAKRPCPVCRRPWFPWVGSVLPCHARCLFTDYEQDAIFADPRIEKVVSVDLGVSVDVVRAAKRMAMRRKIDRHAE